MTRLFGISAIDPDRLAVERFGGSTSAATMRASRLALQFVQDALHKGQDIAQETTLSGGQPLRLMEAARKRGYAVFLVFITIGDDTRLRIDNRVLQGGHDISNKDLQRRTPRILGHLAQAVTLADLTVVYSSYEVTRDFVLTALVRRRVVLHSPFLPAEVRAAVAPVSVLIEDEGQLEQEAKALQAQHSFVRWGAIKDSGPAHS